jgi:hypothetical protein
MLASVVVLLVTPAPGRTSVEVGVELITNQAIKLPGGMKIVLRPGVAAGPG